MPLILSTPRFRRILLAKNDLHKIKGLLKELGRFVGALPVSTALTDTKIECFESVPLYTREPSVIFLAQVWRPSRVKTDELKWDREQINEMRANLVRALRQEFGDRFIGGVIPNDYATANYKDCLVPDVRITTKRNFMQLVKQTPICIATTGLLGSIGYKFAEYIVAARAIVSEANVNQVYGPFAKEQNYLEFDSVNQCIGNVQRLFDDPELRLKMMRNNFAYYHGYLRPDMLVLNSLYDALAKC